MERKLASTLGRLERKDNGYVTMMSYAYSQFCTKADPMALLQIEIERDGIVYNLEQVAYVIVHDREGDDDKIDLIPKNGPEDISCISTGVYRSYPEFIQSLETAWPVPEEGDEDDQEDSDNLSQFEDQFGASDDDDDDKGQTVFIRLTIPPVDDDRKKAINDAIDAVRKATRTAMDAEYTIAAGDVARKVISAPGDAEKAGKRLDSIKKQYEDLVESETARKKKEVEEANIRYHQQEEQLRNAGTDDDSWQKLKVN